MDEKLRDELSEAIFRHVKDYACAEDWWESPFTKRGDREPIEHLLDRLAAIVIEHKSAADAETARQRSLVGRAVSGLKHLGPFHYEPGSDPHPLDCSLAWRVSRIFGMGMTRASLLCRHHGEDPHFTDKQEECDDDVE